MKVKMLLRRNGEMIEILKGEPAFRVGDIVSVGGVRRKIIEVILDESGKDYHVYQFEPDDDFDIDISYETGIDCLIESDTTIKETPSSLTPKQQSPNI